jgi:hypothetical protein
VVPPTLIGEKPGPQRAKLVVRNTIWHRSFMEHIAPRENLTWKTRLADARRRRIAVRNVEHHAISGRSMTTIKRRIPHDSISVVQ